MRSERPPAGHRPCIDPSVCRVRFHRLGTQCKAETMSRRSHRSTLDLPSLDAPSSAMVVSSPESIERFSLEEGGYYGNNPPRSIQIDALNGTIEALDRDDKTQLVAACGTGKTYMGRQLLNHYMSQEDSNGVSVVLTSSRKLASDTARDMRPGKDDDPDSFDAGFGTYGEDYEVIEVHSDAQDYDQHGIHRRSIRDRNGNISSDMIRGQIEDALLDGKKVVVVSTYKSSRRVQSAQKLIGEDAEADLIMHDEAHNILGQQKSPTKSDLKNQDDDAVSDATVYTGFDNSIPGAIQARKRLYATATPVMREFAEDDESEESIESAKRTADRILSGHGDERVTFYSTDVEVVGGIGGYISQRDAIDQGYLAEPVYQVRRSVINGDVTKFRDPVVSVNGYVTERDESLESKPMSPATYSSVSSTLEAMVDTPKDGASPRNVLIYSESIDQAEAASEGIKRVAFSMSAGMDLDQARDSVDHPDPSIRRRARLRVLSETLDSRSAHSNTPQREKESAFKMFEGSDVKDTSWSPDCKVLANVDIFSEGVNIPQIDGVTFSDRSKLSERGMTQAVGRSIRTISGNDVKSQGYVIIPEVVDQEGHDLNKSDRNRALYGATRVERGTTASSIAGRKEGTQPDRHTKVTWYTESGEVERQDHAWSEVQEMVSNVTDLGDGHFMSKMMGKAKKDNPETWDSMTKSEQFSVARSGIAERIEVIHSKGDYASSREMKEMMVLENIKRGIDAGQYDMYSADSARVDHDTVMSAIPVGDIGAMSGPIRNSFIKNGILVKQEDETSGPSVQSETEHVRQRHALSNVGPLLAEARADDDKDRRKRIMEVAERCGIDKDLMTRAVIPTKVDTGRILPRKPKPGSLGRPGVPGESAVETQNRLNRHLNEFVAHLQSDPNLMRDFMSASRMGNGLGGRNKAVQGSLAELESAEERVALNRASEGQDSYVFNPKMVKKDGHLTDNAIRALYPG